MAMTMPLTTAAQSRKTDWGTTLTPQKKDTVKVVKGAAEATKDTVKTANGAAKVAKDTIKATKCIEAAISTEALSTPDTAQTVQAETPLTLTPDTLTQKKKRDWSTWRPETKRAMRQRRRRPRISDTRQPWRRHSCRATCGICPYGS